MGAEMKEIECAEKSEAELKQVNEWHAAALASNQQMQELMTIGLGADDVRVKVLETDRQVPQVEGRQPHARAIATRRHSIARAGA